MATRAEQRARKIRELRAHQADLHADPSVMFPTATPYGGMRVEFSQAPTGVSVLPQSEQVVGTVPEGPLAALAHEINVRLALAERAHKQADDHLVAAAIHLAEVRKICDERKRSFRTWCEDNLTQTYDWVRKLSVIGASENPHAALLDYRDRNAARNKKFRDRKAAAEQITPAPRAAQIEAPAVATPKEEPPQELIFEARSSAALEPVQAPQELTQPPDEVVRAALPLLSPEDKLVVADTAAAMLPAVDARRHVRRMAEVLGLEVKRNPQGSHNYFVTVAGLLEDFHHLSEHDQLEFLEKASASVAGARVEVPA